MFVISHCQTYAFQQTEDEISHFSQDHVKYCDKITLHQLQESATNVLSNVKSASLLRIFSTGLKFTIDILVKWFNEVSKSQFNELDAIKK